MGIYDNKLKTNKIIIEECDDTYLTSLLEYNGLIIKFIKNQTEKQCLTAIRENIHSIQYISNLTSRIISEIDQVIK